MAMLQERINEAKAPKLPILMLDAMVPGQRLEFESDDPRMVALAERGEAAVVGIWEGRPLRYGVIADVARLAERTWRLRGLEHAQVVGPTEPGAEGLTIARVERINDEIKPVDIEVAELFPPLVEEWKSLIEGTTFEKFDGQIQRVLADIGPMPAVEDAGALAFWVAALVNPLPALGVAYEIRPGVLSAASVFERLQVALKGLRGSIGHVSGKRPLF